MTKIQFYIAHRGFSSKYPENSKQAFLKAIKCPVDMIETDIRLSKDKEWIIIHDSNLTRLKNLSKRVRDVTVRFLKKHDILSLRDFVKLINKHSSPSFKLYLDIKGTPTIDELENLLDIIYNSKKSFRYYYLASSNNKVVEQLIDLRQTYPRFNIVSPFGNFKIGLINYHISQINPDMLKALDFISLNHKILNQNYYDELRKIFLFKIFVYTLNDIASLQKYKDMGVDGILSDNCQLFQELK